MNASEDVKILLVDDHPGNLDALEAMLAPSGCTVVRARSADEALLALLQHEFAALILDIRMPEMSGIDLARLIKQRRRTEHVPILFLTAHSSDEHDVLLGYGAGAVDYLSKPINPGILRSKVEVFIDLFKKTRDLARLNEALEDQIAQRRKAQEALEAANQELELRVQERTAALSLAHREVDENEERLRMAVEVAQIAAWDWDLQSGAMHWSSDPEKLFGFPAGAFGPDRRILHALHPEDRARMEAAIAYAISSGAYEGEYRALQPDGSTVWITERGRVVRDEAGRAERMVGISRDVSVQRRAERDRERLLASERAAKEEAERQSRIKDEFFATLSHELRTPMNVILGWLKMIASGTAVQDTPSALAVIQRNAQIQAKLIDDLLDMNRLMIGNVRLDTTTIDLATVVRASAQALQPAADARGVRLSVRVAPTPVLVAADPARLQQVLGNLLSNAIKFNKPGGRVDVHVTSDDTYVRIAISDTGRGISPEFLPHIFERFRREDSSATREVGGLGLGLAIAKHLIELHGGVIDVSSPGDGLGATFVLTLPEGRQTPVLSDVISA